MIIIIIVIITVIEKQFLQDPSPKFSNVEGTEIPKSQLG